MKIISFNTQHCFDYIEKKIDLQKFADTIKSLDADVVGLNEMRGEGTDAEYTEQVKILSELTGMKYYYFAKAIDIQGKGPYGNGMLSKIPILGVETVKIPDPDPKKYSGYYETRCILKAELEGGVTVLITHFGLNPDEQENAVATVVENLRDARCVLMGDFNVRPENPVLDPIRERMQDTAEVFEGERLSFPSDAPDRKIDYLFVSRDVKVLDADIPEIVVSDHRPYTVTVEFE
jgi:endonuclease/exonuclease/phosphatase family metal-dependent hydrolase